MLYQPQLIKKQNMISKVLVRPHSCRMWLSRELYGFYSNV